MMEVSSTSANMSANPNPLKRDHDSFEMSMSMSMGTEIGARADTGADAGGRSRSCSELSDLGPTTPVYEPDMEKSISTATSTSTPMTMANSTNEQNLPNTMNPAQPTQDTSGSAFAALNGTSAPPPAKKAKLSFQEKETKRIQKEIRDHERAAEKAKREAERQAQAGEKAKREAEREAEKRKREAEREEKRAAMEVERAVKEEKKRRKEEEKRVRDEEKKAREEEKAKKEEERLKKERSQRTLGSFFNIPASASKPRSGSVGSRERSSASPAPASVASAAPTPSKPEKSAYQKMFIPFFVHHDVKVGRINRFERDEEATEATSRVLDSYISGERSPERQRCFDAVELFHLPGSTTRRGRACMPVREIMAEMTGNASKPIDLTTDSQNTQIKRTRDLLKHVPVKFLQFAEDVRPPYRGTYTRRPVSGMAKMARNPLRRDLPDTNYDYDSEAEWVEGEDEDEGAEDCNSDGEEEEDAADDDEMDGFLDDENDELLHSKRNVLQGDLEPVSSGLCWENERRRNMNVKMTPYRMEIILGAPEQNLKTIDPFSTAYWTPAPTSSMDPPPPRVPLTTLKAPNGILALSTSSSPSPAGKPVKNLSTSNTNTNTNTNSHSNSSINTNPTHPSSTTDSKPKKLLPPNDMPRFRALVRGNNLSKIGLVEVLKKQFPGQTGAAVKNTLERYGRREGRTEREKVWVVEEEDEEVGVV